MRTLIYYYRRLCMPAVFHTLTTVFPDFFWSGWLPTQRGLLLSQLVADPHFQSTLNQHRFNFSATSHQRKKIIRSAILFFQNQAKFPTWPSQLKAIREEIMAWNHRAHIDQALYSEVRGAILRSHQPHVHIYSFGCGAGEHEAAINMQLVAEKIISKNRTITWHGVDTNVQAKNFFQAPGNTFQLIKPGEHTSWFRNFTFKSKPKSLNIFLFILSLHHIEASASELQEFCIAADTTIIFDELISLKTNHNVEAYALLLAHDIIANISFQTEWSHKILHEFEFSAKYLPYEPLTRSFHIKTFAHRSPAAHLLTWRHHKD